ncbi:DUF4376 domain-containing protein [Rhizobium sp. RCAM05973]|uniref:DUF4376 domain-containing protein n=1 Tax=Rhizobium sp. RCAM05973 TaxID=2994066 RepID=UPI0022EC14BA|nr:DUF4376 domain-containing protein [Rhizobium sp. RCAM05973]
MNSFARVINGTVFEIIQFPDGVTPAQALPASLATDCYPCANDVGQGWTYSKGNFAAPIPAVPSVADLTAYAATKRYALETGGFTYDGHPISTDRDSQGKIGNVALAANIVGSSFSTSFKCSDGSFFTLNHDGAIEMATAVMTFISACFDTEATVALAIAAGTISTIAQIDAASWPANG